MATNFIGINILHYPTMRIAGSEDEGPTSEHEYFNIDHISHIFENGKGFTSFTILNDDKVYITNIALADFMALLVNA